MKHKFLNSLMILSILLMQVFTVMGVTPAYAASTTFNYTGAEQQYVVPAGVTEVTIDAYGAQGRNGSGGNAGGLGARAQATITVTPGETLYIYVGGRNTGYNGGGGGNGGGNGVGGGGSDVRQGGNATSNRVVVAGGGGGGGGYVGGNGGNGGNPGGTGATGFGNPGGTGGNSGTGGTGGTGQSNGTSGNSFSGGNGGASLSVNNSGGGGGGGGWGGGGGGAGGSSGGGGGGGGGSLATGGTITSGVQSGDGQIILTPVLPPAAPTVSTDSFTTIQQREIKSTLSDFGVPDSVTAHGVVYNETGSPTTADSVSNKGAASSTGEYSVGMDGLGLTPGTKYYVRAFATNATGTAYGDELVIYGPPAAFTINSPANNATGVSTSPTLSWTASTGADDYQYCVAVDINDCVTDFFDTTYWHSTAGLTSADLTDLLPGTTYQWGVRASVGTPASYTWGMSGGPYTFTTIDNVPPTVEITSSVSDPTNDNPIPVTITFSEDVTGFAVEDLTVSNGAAGNFQTVSASEYTADITPTADGYVTVDVGAAVAQDSASNDNEAATRFSVEYDSSAPSVEITSAVSDPTNDNPISIAITFSEPGIPDFNVNGFVVGNGTLDNFQRLSSYEFTADITPTGDGTVTVDLPADSATDFAGNGNEAATQFSVEYDGTAPTVEITSTVSDPTSDNPIPVTITFVGGGVLNFTVDDIVVGNGSAGNFQQNTSMEFTADITPTAEGQVTVDVNAGAAQDPAGNDNEAATQFSVEYVVPAAPTVSTDSITTLQDRQVNANLTNLGYPASVSAHGVVYNTTGTPEIGVDSVVNKGATTTTGAYTVGLGEMTLTAGTKYYVRAYATNDTGTSYGDELVLYGLPGSFSVTAPADDATGVSTVPTLSWTASEAATDYQYCVETDIANCTNDFFDTNYWHSTGGATSATLSGLSTSTLYYWGVRASVGDPASYTWGTNGAYSFTTDSVASYTVTFDGNGSDGGSMSPQSSSSAANLTANAFTKTGFTFAGWNSMADGSSTDYADEAEYPFTEDVTLFAQWTESATTATLSVSNPIVMFNGTAKTASVVISASSVPGTVTNVRYNGSTTKPVAAGVYTITANFVPNDANYPTLTNVSAGTFTIRRQLLANRGFENAGSTSADIKGWIGNTLGAKFSRVTNMKRAGNASARLDATTLETLQQIRNISGPAGAKLNLAYFVKGSSLPTGSICNVKVQLYNGSTLKQTKTLSCGTGSTFNWRSRNLTFNTTSAFTKAVITITSQHTAGILWFDNLSLIIY